MEVVDSAHGKGEGLNLCKLRGSNYLFQFGRNRELVPGDPAHLLTNRLCIDVGKPLYKIHSLKAILLAIGPHEVGESRIIKTPIN